MPEEIFPTSFGVLIGMLVLGYLLGSIPFGLLLARAAGLGDVRKIGSGNIGATNVLRTGNKKVAALTLLFDILKGTLAAWIGTRWSVEAGIAAGLGAFLGHLYPVWLGFKGGKGVATYLGVLLALAWQGALAFAVIWLGTAFATRYSSLAALLATIAVPITLIVLWVLGLVRGEVAALFALMSLIVIVKHRGNISKLMAGTESHIGSKG